MTPPVAVFLNWLISRQDELDWGAAGYCVQAYLRTESITSTYFHHTHHITSTYFHHIHHITSTYFHHIHHITSTYFHKVENPIPIHPSRPRGELSDCTSMFCENPLRLCLRLCGLQTSTALDRLARSGCAPVQFILHGNRPL